MSLRFLAYFWGCLTQYEKPHSILQENIAKFNAVVTYLYCSVIAIKVYYYASGL